MATNENKPKRYNVYGIFGKSIIEHVTDVFKGNLSSTATEKITKRVDKDEDLHSVIAYTVVQQIKNITEDHSTLKSQIPVVNKILDKIYKNDEFQKLVISKINYVNLKRKEILSELQSKLK